MSKQPKLTKAQRQLLESVLLPPFTDEQNERLKNINKHSVENPHWSFSVVQWPSDRWDDISTAPKDDVPIRIRCKRFGRSEIDDVYSFKSGEFQTIDDRKLLRGVSDIGWQPVHAIDNPTYEELSRINAEQIKLLEDRIQFLKNNPYRTFQSIDIVEPPKPSCFFGM